jgi:hypothetical protein
MVARASAVCQTLLQFILTAQLKTAIISYYLQIQARQLKTVVHKD